MTAFSPSAGVRATPAYAPERPTAPCDIDLAGTEAGGVPPALMCGQPDAELARGARYPDPRTLASLLAARRGVAAEHVLVTAGADDALERACRAMLSPGRNAIVTDPTFEMIPRYIALTGAELRAAPWPSGALPADELISLADERTSLVAIVSPNNPTGAVATIAEIRRVHDAIPTALILLDLAYIEFADDDITEAALTLPRVVATRTLSKAWGMPGIRVGYAAGAPETIAWMRRAGGPYAVSAVSLGIAERALRSGGGWRDATVTAVRRNRERLDALLTDLGAAPLASQANFVTVAGGAASWIADALAGFSVATRLLAGSECTRVRITVPTSDAVFERLELALRTALAPEAILFDLDGVLADVTEVHQRLDQGHGAERGLKERESLVVTREWLASLAARLPLAIVTGRSRADATALLSRSGVLDLFAAVITRDDGPIAPDRFPVAAACRALGTTRAWMLGDTPDDIVSARSAGVLPIGVVAPGDAAELLRDSLTRAGASRVLNTTTELTSCLS